MGRERGFTLVELLAVLAVAAVLAAMALPAMVALRENWGTQEALHSLTLSLARARIAAVVRGQPVTVCPSSDGRTCRSDLVWDEGWITYADPDRSDQPLDDGQRLWVEQKTGSALAIRSTRGRHRIRFQPTGFSGGYNASLRICSRRRAELVGSLVLNMAGRARITREAPGTRPPCPFVP